MSEAEEKARLIKQMGSRDNKVVRAAVEILSERGWLEDGSLRKADLRGADLRRAYLRRADLCEANLREAYLRGADLFETDLRGANLTKAELVVANMRGANLSKAELVVADLRGANLSGADLSAANLNGANLNGANLNGSNLRDADFSDTMCSFTIFADVDLSRIKGLETVRHRSASHIDTHTLQKSGGNIPEMFLRGCGVSDEFIEFTRGLFGKVIEFYSCFISYSHTDKAFARRLHDTLQGRGVRCWLDEKAMRVGDDIRQSINQGIRLHDKFLLCCSKTSLHSDWVEEELSHLFEKEKDTGRLALIPLNMDGYLFNGYQGKYGAKIRARLAADFTGWEHDNARFESEFERVLLALKSHSLPAGGTA